MMVCVRAYTTRIPSLSDNAAPYQVVFLFSTVPGGSEQDYNQGKVGVAAGGAQ